MEKIFVRNKFNKSNKFLKNFISRSKKGIVNKIKQF